jgi:hypothetical protein
MATNAAFHARELEICAPQYGGGGAKEFDRVSAPLRRRVEARRAIFSDIPELLGDAEVAMGISLAHEDTVRRIVQAHPDSLWSFWRNGKLVGGFAMLMLNPSGLLALLRDCIDLKDPPTSLLMAPGQPPAAIYVWAVFGPFAHAEGIARVIERLRQPPYAQSDVYALPATADGLRFMRRLGFRTVAGHRRSLHRYVRLANRTQASWES